MEQLSGLDAMFIHAELHGMPMHISSLSIYDPSAVPNGAVAFRQFVDLFERIVHRNVPILRCRLQSVLLNLDQPYWVEDPNFDLVYHLRHIALPRPGNWQKLCSMVANLHAQPLNRSRPLWEAYVIDGLDNIEDIPPGSFGLMLKVHHSIMDGRTGMEIYKNLHTFGNNPHCMLDDHPDASIPITRPEQEAVVYRQAIRAVSNNIHKTGSLVRMLGKSAGLASEVFLGLRNKEIKQLRKPKTRFNGAISPRRVVDRIRLPLQEVRFMKKLFTDETVNDVAMALIGGALRRYLLAKDELPEESLVAAVPIDVRAPEDHHISGNRISITNMALRTDIADPLERLCVMHKESISGKAFANTLGKTIVNDALDSLYSGLTAWGIRMAVNSGVLEKFPPFNNTVVTNVPGSPVPLYLCGAKLVDSFGMGPLIPNTGLFHTVSSTYDFLTIAFTADRNKMPDPDFYVQCLEESYCEMLDAAREEVARRAVLEDQLLSTGSNRHKVRRRSGSNRIRSIEDVAATHEHAARSCKKIAADKVLSALVAETRKAEAVSSLEENQGG